MTQPVRSDWSPEFWQDRISRLLAALTTEAQANPGAWAERQIRQGYTVALVVRPDRRRVVSVSRSDRPARGNLAAWDRQATEVSQIQTHLGIAHWEPIAPDGAPPAAWVAWFVEPQVTE